MAGMTLRLTRALHVIGVSLALSGAAQAQASDPQIRSSVVVIDPERLVSETNVGARISAELDIDATRLAAENRQIEAALIAEEQELTTARASMTPEDFRVAADAFDEKVTRIRAEQDRKSRVLTARREQERRAFLDAALPVLGSLLADFGAYAILDRRDVFLTDERIDVTDEAIARIDAALGAARERNGAPETPDPAPDTPDDASAEDPTEDPAPE